MVNVNPVINGKSFDSALRIRISSFPRSPIVFVLAVFVLTSVLGCRSGGDFQLFNRSSLNENQKLTEECNRQRMLNDQLVQRNKLLEERIAESELLLAKVWGNRPKERMSLAGRDNESLRTGRTKLSQGNDREDDNQHSLPSVWRVRGSSND